MLRVRGNFFPYVHDVPKLHPEELWSYEEAVVRWWCGSISSNLNPLSKLLIDSTESQLGFRMCK